IVAMNKPNSDLVINTEGWKTVNWRQAERYVFKLQKRIYAASRRGDVKRCRRLQKTLMRSWSNRVLAVRRVTVENQGKKTAGVDGIKSLPPKARLELAGQLKLTGKSKPTRRVWIPKPGKEEKRPLGIPVMYDRALQAVVKAALEPEWEAIFEPNSYGFRPGRSCHDAIKQIKLCIQKKAKYALDADIAKCFDRINHEALLQKLNIKGKVRQQIKAWLKSGVIDRLSFQEWDVLEIDHIIPRAIGGKDEYKNLQLLHRHCHNEKTAIDLKEIRKKNHSKFLEKLSQFWEKFDWEWINDIPFFKGLKVRKPENDK
ncbi:group II intron reverse transcriptase/maturase, partial [Nostoc sp.]